MKTKVIRKSKKRLPRRKVSEITKDLKRPHDREVYYLDEADELDEFSPEAIF